MHGAKILLGFLPTEVVTPEVFTGCVRPKLAISISRGGRGVEDEEEIPSLKFKHCYYYYYFIILVLLLLLL